MHYEHMVSLCEVIETSEQSRCEEARLFSNGCMRIDKVRKGYETLESYRILRGQDGQEKAASIDAMFELQTILIPQPEKVGAVLERLKEDYKKKVKKAAEAAAEAANETETQVESEWTQPMQGQGTTE